MELVTYTYNDHAFVDLLIAKARRRLPDIGAIHVVDDCSATPYIPRHEGVFVHRTPANLGPGQAKRFGLTLPRGEVFLSVDADIGFGARWLAAAMGCLGPDVGLVGATIVQMPFDDLLTKALFHATSRDRQNRAVEFLPAGLWLVNANALRAVGGLEDFAQATHEDLHLALKLRQHGYRMIRCDTARVYQRRRLDRLAYARRHANYMAGMHHALLAAGNLAGFLEANGRELETAAAVARTTGNAYLVYMSLLQAVLILAWLSGREGWAAVEGNGSLLTAFQSVFRNYKLLCSQITVDTLPLGARQAIRPEAETTCALFFDFLRQEYGEAVLRQADAFVRNIVADDKRRHHYDFHYAATCR